MYSVIWKTAALDHLADLYVAVSTEDRSRLSGGVESFNRQLEQDPSSIGESRTGGLRIAFLPLLVVTFQVNETTRVVRVLAVTRYGH